MWVLDEVSMLEWLCLDCSFNEQEALKVFQEQGIRDPLALSVVMASVKQESKFIPNICEGGRLSNRSGHWRHSCKYLRIDSHCNAESVAPSVVAANGRVDCRRVWILQPKRSDVGGEVDSRGSGKAVIHATVEQTTTVEPGRSRDRGVS